MLGARISDSDRVPGVKLLLAACSSAETMVEMPDARPGSVRGCSKKRARRQMLSQPWLVWLGLHACAKAKLAGRSCKESRAEDRPRPVQAESGGGACDGHELTDGRTDGWIWMDSAGFQVRSGEDQEAGGVARTP